MGNTNSNLTANAVSINTPNMKTMLDTLAGLKRSEKILDDLAFSSSTSAEQKFALLQGSGEISLRVWEFTNVITTCGGLLLIGGVL